MYEIKENDLNTNVLGKYLYQTYNNAFTFYVLSYDKYSWQIVRNISVQSNYTIYGGGMRITYGNLDWVTQATKDDSFVPCTLGELIERGFK